MQDVGSTKYTCHFPDGRTEEVSYSAIKDYNNDIIKDNIFYGYKHPGDYSEKEIKKYEKEAVAENKRFLRYLRENPGTEIAFDQRTEMFAEEKS